MPNPSAGELIWANIMQVHTELLYNTHVDLVDLLRLLEDTTAWLPNLNSEFQQVRLRRRGTRNTHAKSNPTHNTKAIQHNTRTRRVPLW